MDTKEHEPEVTVSLAFLWRTLRKYWLVLLAVSLCVALLVGVLYYTLSYTPLYTTKARYYVSNISNGTFLYSSGQTSAANDMASYCLEFIQGSDVLNDVLERTDLPEGKKPSAAQLKSMISAVQSSDSAIFEVRVSGSDSLVTYEISRAIETVLPAYCDYYNNQFHLKDENGNLITDVSEGDIMNIPEKPDFENKSLMLKVINTGEMSKTAVNRFNVIKYPIIAGGATCVLLYLLLLIISLNDLTVYGKHDFSEKLPDAVLLGIIPHWSIKEERKSKKKLSGKKQKLLHLYDTERLISGEHVPVEISEAFYQLCTNITFCSTDEKGCTVASLSGTACAGKSFITANLAILLSRLIDKKVLLVDADMRCPRQHRILRLDNKRGLSNLLAGQCADEPGLYRSFEQGSLHVLTSGTVPPNPVELLSSARMKDLLEKWGKEYDYILIDLPPVGEVTDAAVISKWVNGYLYIARSGLADVRAIREASAVVEDKGAKIFGYVLTDVEEEPKKAYQYYNGYRRSGTANAAENAEQA